MVATPPRPLQCGGRDRRRGAVARGAGGVGAEARVAGRLVRALRARAADARRSVGHLDPRGLGRRAHGAGPGRASAPRGAPRRAPRALEHDGRRSRRGGDARPRRRPPAALSTRSPGRDRARARSRTAAARPLQRDRALAELSRGARGPPHPGDHGERPRVAERLHSLPPLALALRTGARGRALVLRAVARERAPARRARRPGRPDRRDRESQDRGPARRRRPPVRASRASASPRARGVGCGEHARRRRGGRARCLRAHPRRRSDGAPRAGAAEARSRRRRRDPDRRPRALARAALGARTRAGGALARPTPPCSCSTRSASSPASIATPGSPSSAARSSRSAVTTSSSPPRSGPR